MHKARDLAPFIIGFVLALASSADGGVTFQVSAVSETTTLVLPHPTQLGDPEITRRPPARPIRRKQNPMRVTADVRMQGSHIRLDYRLDMGRGFGRVATMISRDGGMTFYELAEDGATRLFPLPFSLDPAAMSLRAMLTLGVKTDATDVRIDQVRINESATYDRRPANRHRARARFVIPPDERFRRPKLNFTSETEVIAWQDVPEPVPPGLLAWSTGIPSVDAALRARVAGAAGFPVKAVNRLEMESGRTRQTTVATLEVSGLTVAPLDSRSFAPAP